MMVNGLISIGRPQNGKQQRELRSKLAKALHLPCQSWSPTEISPATEEPLRLGCSKYAMTCASHLTMELPVVYWQQRFLLFIVNDDEFNAQLWCCDVGNKALGSEGLMVLPVVDAGWGRLVYPKKIAAFGLKWLRDESDIEVHDLLRCCTFAVLRSQRIPKMVKNRLMMVNKQQ